MKPIIPFALLGALFAVGAASAATTTPVGYITVPIAGNTGGSPAGAGTFVSAPLANPILFASAATTSPSGGATVSFSGGVPAGLDGAHILEVTSGDQEGWWTTIVGSTADSITVSDTFPAGVAVGATVSVRRFTTIQDVFGENEVGLADGVDEIQVIDAAGVGQPTKTIVRAGDGWFDFVTEAAAEDEIIYPGTSVKVIRKLAAPLSLVAVGEVRTTKTQADVFPGTNWISQPNPIGETFAGLTIATQINDSSGTPDFIDILRPDQSADTFVSAAGSMFNFVTEANADAEALAEGTGFILRRSNAATSSTIIYPGQIVAP